MSSIRCLQRLWAKCYLLRSDISSFVHLERTLPCHTAVQSGRAVTFSKAYHTTTVLCSEDKKEEKIKLLDFEKVKIVTLPEAKRLARVRNLQLVKMENDDPGLNVYKFVMLEDYAEMKEQQREIKSKDKQKEKILTIKSNISEADLLRKVRDVSNWISKDIFVRVVIVKKGTSSLENVHKIIAENLKDGQIKEQSSKSSVLKLQILRKS